MVFYLLPAPLGNAKVWVPPDKAGPFDLHLLGSEECLGKSTAKEKKSIKQASPSNPSLVDDRTGKAPALGTALGAQCSWRL